MKKLLLTAALISVATLAHAQSNAPREVAENVAEAVEQNFYDEARARTIAAEVRAAASAGRYDINDPAQLATALTTTLSPHDNHFRVEYTPPGADSGGRAPPTLRTPGGAPPPGSGPVRSPGAPNGVDARGNYGIPSAIMHPGGVGVIDIRGFWAFSTEDAASSPAKRAMDAALTMVSGAQALVFDLRDCGGGSPAMVGYLVGHFAPEGANIYNTFHGREGPEGQELPPVPPATGQRLNTPIFIVISGRTGSACESFAYTMQSARLATIVGDASAGAANPGGMIPVGEGLAVFVSAGTPINPITGRNWEGAGVIPNVAVPANDALTHARALALEAVAASNDQAAALEANWALASLRAESAPAPRNLNQYAGAYGPRTISVENNRLMLRRDRRPPLTLLPLERDLFAVEGAAPLQRIRFDRDTRGRITGLTLNLVSGQQIRALKD